VTELAFTGADAREAVRAKAAPEVFALCEALMALGDMSWEHVAFAARRVARDTSGSFPDELLATVPPVELAEAATLGGFIVGFLTGLATGAGGGRG
jgi:hypothetical protein